MLSTPATTAAAVNATRPRGRASLGAQDPLHSAVLLPCWTPREPRLGRDSASERRQQPQGQLSTDTRRQMNSVESRDAGATHGWSTHRAARRGGRTRSRTLRMPGPATKWHSDPRTQAATTETLRLERTRGRTHVVLWRTANRMSHVALPRTAEDREA